MELPSFGQIVFYIAVWIENGRDKEGRLYRSAPDVRHCIDTSVWNNRKIVPFCNKFIILLSESMNKKRYFMKEHTVLREIGAFLVIFFSFTWLFWLIFSSVSGLYSVLVTGIRTLKAHIQRRALESTIWKHVFLFIKSFGKRTGSRNLLRYIGLKKDLYCP